MMITVFIDSLIAYHFLCSPKIWSSLARLLIFVSMSCGWLLIARGLVSNHTAHH